MKIYCCNCEQDVDARLTDGEEIYPSRQDLYHLPFWICDTCRYYVGCHHKTNKPTRPLGVIPTPEIQNARRHLHKLIDPAWKSGAISRTGIYAEISKRIGKKYHTANIRSVEEARQIYRVARSILAELNTQRPTR